MGPVKPVVVATSIGVDVGQRNDPSAMVVSEQLPGDRHRVHHIERLALQTAYPQVARHGSRPSMTRPWRCVSSRRGRRGVPGAALTLTRPCDHPPRSAPEASVYVMVDATGCGLPGGRLPARAGRHRTRTPDRRHVHGRDRHQRLPGMPREGSVSPRRTSSRRLKSAHGLRPACEWPDSPTPRRSWPTS